MTEVTPSPEDLDYEVRKINSQVCASVVANELREIAAWVERYTGGTALVDDTGLVDDLLDRYQRDDPVANLTDVIARSASSSYCTKRAIPLMSYIEPYRSIAAKRAQISPEKSPGCLSSK